MNENVFLLSKREKNKLLFFDLIFLFLLIVGGLFFYIYSPKLNYLFFVPVLLFLVYKLFLINKRGKALIFYNNRLYSWRSGWVAYREIKKVYIAKFRGRRSVMVDLNIGWYEPTVYSDWSLYALPSTLVVISDMDIGEPLELIVNKIKDHFV